MVLQVTESNISPGDSGFDQMWQEREIFNAMETLGALEAKPMPKRLLDKPTKETLHRTAERFG